MRSESGLFLSDRYAAGFKKPQPVTMVGNRIPFPEIASGAISKHPQLETFILEMAATDPKTFLHQVMVAECYMMLREEYIKKISPVTDPKMLSQIDSFLRSRDTGVFLHDAGKWTITEDPQESVAIVNSEPFYNGNNNGHNEFSSIHTDDRKSDHKIAHQLHSLTGGLTIRALSTTSPFMSAKYLQELSTPAFTHHEHFKAIPIFDSKGRSLPSYPRKQLRPIFENDDIFFLLHKLADTEAAMGQPKAYRKHRMPDAQILGSCDTILDNFFARFNRSPDDAEIKKYKGRFRGMVLIVLKHIQEKYSEDVCREIQGFTDSDNMSYPPKEYSEGFLLFSLASHIWQRHKARLGEEKERISQML